MSAARYTYADGSTFTLPEDGWSVEAVAIGDDGRWQAALAFFGYDADDYIAHEIIGTAYYATQDEAIAIATEELDSYTEAMP
jgi:hypothetical protein